MLVGAADPMEGSLVILPGSGLVTLGTFLNNTERGLLIHWLCIFGMIAFGVGAVWALARGVLAAQINIQCGGEF